MRLAHSSRNCVRFWRRCATNSRNRPTPLSGMRAAASFSVLFSSSFIGDLHNEYSTEFTRYKRSILLHGLVESLRRIGRSPIHKPIRTPGQAEVGQRQPLNWGGQARRISERRRATDLSPNAQSGRAVGGADRQPVGCGDELCIAQGQRVRARAGKIKGINSDCVSPGACQVQGRRSVYPVGDNGSVRAGNESRGGKIGAGGGD